MRIWYVIYSLLESDEILKLASQSFCGRLRCASQPGPGNDAIANKVTLNFKKVRISDESPGRPSPWVEPGPLARGNNPSRLAAHKIK